LGLGISLNVKESFLLAAIGSWVIFFFGFLSLASAMFEILILA
jgi:hypothetical protein